MEYTIKPLLLGKFKGSKGQMTYFVDYEKEIWIPMAAWYIKGGNKHILVDTGLSSPAIQRYLFGRPYEEIASFEEALNALGLTPGDIDIVIQTHLHYDHCGNTTKCTRAKVIVQEEEIKFAYSAHALFAGSYNLEYLKDLRFRVVAGDREILDGIRVLHLPGHSPGTQAVAVDTKQGTVAISGFCCVKDNMYPPEKMRVKWPVIAPGVSVNSLQAFDSALRLKSSADIVIPQHEIEFAEMAEIPS